MIYFDNASTSFPKPQEVVKNICHYLEKCGVSPGRGAYPLSEQAEEIVSETRSLLNEFLGGENENHVVFTQNATHSLNLAIKGFLKQGDHVLVCSYSHNSVIRPLENLKRKGVITYDVFELTSDGFVDLEALNQKILPTTRLLIANHASNVIGVISPIIAIGELCRSKSIRFLLDSTQSLGYCPISLKSMPIDILVGTGHKTLMGPSGIGFIYLKYPREIGSLFEGGSGGNLSSSPFHPIQMPYKFEAGTINTTCIAGLKGGLTYLKNRGSDSIRRDAMELTEYAWKQLENINEVVLYGTSDMSKKVPIISFTIKGTLPSEMAYLYAQNNICLRAGIQCAPLVHHSIATLPTGTLRISFGHLNTKDEIDTFIHLTKLIIAEKKYGKTCA